MLLCGRVLTGMRVRGGACVVLVAVSVWVAAVALCWLPGPCAAQPPPGPLTLPGPQSAVPASASAGAVPLTADERASLLAAAARSGYSPSEALSIVQTAYDRHIPLLPGAASTTASDRLLASTSACPPVDATCSFARACAQCYYDQSMPRCLPCLALLECGQQPDCQLQRACKVCSLIAPTAADRPHACTQLATHC